MREHLYQGKQFGNGEWVEGYFVKGKSYGGKGECYIMRNVTSFPFNDYYYDEVDPETVREFSGERDKNEKRVFEGDIAKFTVRYYANGERMTLIKVVEFDNGKFFPVPDYMCESYHIVDFEVIGNKWDNPELLESNI